MGLIMWIISLVINALQLIIIIDALLSWIPRIDRYHPAVVAIRQITTPIYRPIRKLIPPEKTGYLDLSPLIAIVGLTLLGSILQSILVGR